MHTILFHTEPRDLRDRGLFTYFAAQPGEKNGVSREKRAGFAENPGSTQRLLAEERSRGTAKSCTISFAEATEDTQAFLGMPKLLC